MENSTTADARGWWCARTNAFPDGYLLWMPVFFFAVDDILDLASAMIWTLTVLLTALAFWAAGRGRGESWAETLFAFGWMGAWSLSGGLLLLDVDGAAGQWWWTPLALASGAAALALAWSYRHRRQVLVPAATEGRAAVRGDAMIWLTVCAAIYLLLGRGVMPWAAAVLLLLAFTCHLLLATRGRQSRRYRAKRAEADR